MYPHVHLPAMHFPSSEITPTYMSCRQTGACMLCESSVQEVMDLTPVAHLSAIKGRLPFINFFDGFRTSHEIQKIETWDYEDLKEMTDFDAIQAWRDQCLNPNHPCQRGSLRTRISSSRQEKQSTRTTMRCDYCSGVHGQGKCKDRHRLQALQLLRS